MKKTISTKIVSAILVCMLLLSVVTIASAAGNIQDTSWRFDFTGGTTQQTDWRTKENTTKIYIKRTDNNSGYAFKATAMGLKSNGTVLDCSRRYTGSGYTGEVKYVIVQTSGVYYLTNYVRENGCSSAAVKGTRTDSREFIATGVWSPDNSSGI